MRNVYQVLKDKERELERVSGEVEALRLVAPLLADEADGSVGMPAQVVEKGFGKGATILANSGGALALTLGKL